MMLLALYILFLFHETFAVTRPFSPGEAIALEAVFGTTNPQKLLEIAKDPMAYWNEREKALEDEAMPHIEFCKKYTQNCLLCIQHSPARYETSVSRQYELLVRRKRARKRTRKRTHRPEHKHAHESLEQRESRLKVAYDYESPEQRAREREYARRCAIPYGDAAWFIHQPEILEKNIKSIFAEDDPAYPTAVALFTAIACDYTDQPWRHLDTMQDETQFRATVEEFKEHKGLSHEFNSRLFWVTRKNSKFSIFDCLIMLSKKKYLCATAPFPAMQNYKAHQLSVGSFIFSGRSGPISHDAISHAQNQYLLEERLRDYGISYHEYFKQCWSEEKLIKDNIFELGRQCLGCFYHFRELATVTGAWDPNDLSSLIFPETVHLTDTGFLEIVPYFSEPMDENFDWKQTPCRPKDMSPEMAHKALLQFRSTYCRTQGNALLYPPKQES